ncbi:MAG: chorismate mutase [Rickettsiales bacterium]|nr:chorismate mutase [Rickettsiales bacterium]
MNKNLAQFREKINQLDDEIIKILEERQKIVNQVSKLKAENISASFLMPKREKEMLARLKSSSSSIPQELIQYIWRGIISFSLFSEKDFKINKSHITSEDELTKYFAAIIPIINHVNIEETLHNFEKHNEDIIILSYQETIKHHKLLLNKQLVCFKKFEKDEALAFAKITQNYLDDEKFLLLGKLEKSDKTAKLIYQDKNFDLFESEKNDQNNKFLGSY